MKRTKALTLELASVLDKQLPFHAPNSYPPERGLYVRDWRKTKITPKWERLLSIDVWEPDDDPRSIIFPGCWYVLPEFNDASIQHLPWRPATAGEVYLAILQFGDLVEQFLEGT